MAKVARKSKGRSGLDFAQLSERIDGQLTQFGIYSHGPLTPDDPFPGKKGQGHSAQGAKRPKRNVSARQDHGGKTPSPAYAVGQNSLSAVGQLIELADGVLAQHDFDSPSAMPDSLAEYQANKKRKRKIRQVGTVVGSAGLAGVAARKVSKSPGVRRAISGLRKTVGNSLEAGERPFVQLMRGEGDGKGKAAVGAAVGAGATYAGVKAYDKLSARHKAAVFRGKENVADVLHAGKKKLKGVAGDAKSTMRYAAKDGVKGGAKAAGAVKKAVKGSKVVRKLAKLESGSASIDLEQARRVLAKLQQLG